MSPARKSGVAVDGRPVPSRRSRLRGGRLLLAAWFWLAPAAAGAEVPILPLHEVRPGMEGFGRTVFSGDSVSTFPVQILDVLPGVRARGSLILFRAGGELLSHSGIIAGMSGSPVYVDGRLVGAVAFAYPLLKDPIGAITPIEEMLAVDRLPALSAEEADGVEAGPAERSSSPGSELGSEVDPLGAPAHFAELWGRFTTRSARGWLPVSSAPTAEWSPLRPAGSGNAVVSSGSLQTMAVPLTLQGWDAALATELSGALRPLGFVSARDAGFGTGDIAVPGLDFEEPAPGRSAAARSGASTSAVSAGAVLIEPGSAIAVPFITGDAILSAIGTVTVVDEGRVIAFGHPLVQGGPVSLPFWGARIHSVMPSLEVSFKLGSATVPLGVILQDRRAGVAGALGAVPETIPLRVTIRSRDGMLLNYRYHLVRDRILTPLLLPWPVANSWLHLGWSQGDAVAICRTTVGYNRGAQVRRVDHIRADAPPLQFAAAAILPASLLLVNPFERASLDSIGIDLEVERRNAQAFVTGVRCDRPRARVGEEVPVTVTVEPWRGEREERRFTLRMRPEWANARLQVTAGSAGAFSEADRDRAPGKYTPRNLEQLVHLVETYPNDASLILRVYAPGEGSLVEGRELPRLPPSIAGPGTETGARAVIRSTSGRLLEEVSVETSWVLIGRETTELEVMP